MNFNQLKYQTELKHKILKSLRITKVNIKFETFIDLIDFRFDSTDTKLILKLDMEPNSLSNLFKANFDFTGCVPDYKAINKFDATFHFNLI